MVYNSETSISNFFFTIKIISRFLKFIVAEDWNTKVDAAPVLVWIWNVPW